MKPLSTDVLRSLTVCVALCFASSLSSVAMGQVPEQGRAASAPADMDSLQDIALREAQAGKVDEAIRDYQRVLAARPDWEAGRWNLGTLQYSADRFSDAESTFRKVVEFAPTMGTAWGLLGLSEFETKDFSDSLAHLDKAQSLGIDDDDTKRVAAYHLGLLLVRSGNFNRARDLLLATFGDGAISPQVKYALGLAMLRVPLLPNEVDPSQESLVLAAGDLASAGEKALALFPDFIAAHPDVPYVHYSYGLTLSGAGRNAEAQIQMREETGISPESPLPWLELSRIELQLRQPGQAQISGTRAKTLASAEKADRERRIILRYAGAAPKGDSTTANQEDPELWNRAMQEYGTGQYTLAIADLKPWLKKHPGSGTGWGVLGLSEFSMKDFDNALIHLNRGEALGLQGDADSLRTAKYTLGILLIRAGEFDRASELLASALRESPQDEKIEYALGLSLLRKAKLPGQTDARQRQLVGTAGKIAGLLRDSRYDEAFPLFKRLLQEHPSEPFLHYAYGTALLALSEYEEAAAQMRAEILISPNNELPYVRLASIELKEHRAANAIPFARQALVRSPQSAEAHYLLGRACLEAGDDAAALHELEIAASLSPASPEVHFNLAKAYSRANMPEAAAKERGTFARLNELSDLEKSQNNRIYAGPRSSNDVSRPSIQEAAPPQKPD